MSKQIEEIRAEFEEWYMSLHGSDPQDIERRSVSSVFANKGDYYEPTFSMYISWVASYQQAVKDVAPKWISVDDAMLNDQNDYWVIDLEGEVFSAKYWGGEHPFFGGTDGEFYASICAVSHIMRMVKPEAPSHE